MRIRCNVLIKRVFLTLLAGLLVVNGATTGFACTAITLKAKDGTLLFGRTMEWGAFDLNGRIIVIPPGCEFTGQTPDGKPGLRWQAQYGVVGIDMLEREVLSDGINEKGLALGLLYHPGFAEYTEYDPGKAGQSMAPTDVGQFILTTCSSVSDVREAMEKIRVVPVVEPALGFPAPVHFIVVDSSGKQIVIEFLGGETVITDAPLGVLTNAPTYDWHITNLRNYINLSPVSLPGRKIEELEFKPLGAGSGMIGLPGDFTPPSRFIRAVAFTVTARKTVDGPETMYEVFRVLDNFNIPLGAAEGTEHGGDISKMRSATLWTSVYDTKNGLMYYHTQHNRRVRKLDTAKIDFDKLGGRVAGRPLDKVKAQDMEDVDAISNR